MRMPTTHERTLLGLFSSRSTVFSLASFPFSSPALLVHWLNCFIIFLIAWLISSFRPSSLVQLIADSKNIIQYLKVSLPVSCLSWSMTSLVAPGIYLSTPSLRGLSQDVTTSHDKFNSISILMALVNSNTFVIFYSFVGEVHLILPRLPFNFPLIFSSHSLCAKSWRILTL